MMESSYKISTMRKLVWVVKGKSFEKLGLKLSHLKKNPLINEIVKKVFEKLF